MSSPGTQLRETFPIRVVRSRLMVVKGGNSSHKATAKCLARTPCLRKTRSFDSTNQSVLAPGFHFTSPLSTHSLHTAILITGFCWKRAAQLLLDHDLLVHTHSTQVFFTFGLRILSWLLQSKSSQTSSFRSQMNAMLPCLCCKWLAQKHLKASFFQCVARWHTASCEPGSKPSSTQNPRSLRSH